jgi:hypothetical protein
MNSRGLGNSFLQGWLYSLEEKKKQQEMADREWRETARDNRQFSMNILGNQINRTAENTMNQQNKEEERAYKEQEKVKEFQKQATDNLNILQTSLPDVFSRLPEEYKNGTKPITDEMTKYFINSKEEEVRFNNRKKELELQSANQINLETLRGKNDIAVQGMRNLPEPPKIITDEENLAARQLIKTIKPEFQFENRKYSMDEAKQYNQNWRDANNGVKPTVQKKTVPLSAEGQRIMKKAKDLYAKTRKNPAEWNAALQEGGILYSILDSAPLSTDEFNTLDYEIRMLDDSSISKPIKDKSFDASNIIGQESPAYTKGKMIGYYK